MTLGLTLSVVKPTGIGDITQFCAILIPSIMLLRAQNKILSEVKDGQQAICKYRLITIMTEIWMCYLAAGNGDLQIKIKNFIYRYKEIMVMVPLLMLPKKQVVALGQTVL